MKDIHYAIPPFYFAIGGVFFAPVYNYLTRDMMFNEKSKPLIANRDVTKDPDGKIPSVHYDNTTIILILLASFFSFLGQVFMSRAF